MVEYITVILLTAFQFYKGLFACMGFIKSFPTALIVFNLGALLGFMILVLLELGCFQGGNLFLKRTKFGQKLLNRLQYLLRKFQSKKSQEKKISRKIKLEAFLERRGTLGLFFLSIWPIPYAPAILISLWITLRLKNGLLAMILGNICKATIALTVMYLFRYFALKTLL